MLRRRSAPAARALSPLLLFVLAATSAGCAKHLTLHNDSERVITTLSLATPGSDAWGKDVLDGNHIGALGGTFSFDFFDCASFDVRLTVAAADGTSDPTTDAPCVLRDEALCAGEWHITNDDLTACGISVGAADGGGGDGADGAANGPSAAGDGGDV